MKILSAQYQRNGISGRPFYAAIVRDPFHPKGSGGDFLVVSLDSEDERASEDTPETEETFVISMHDLLLGKLVDRWRGDHISVDVLHAIRAKVRREQEDLWRRSKQDRVKFGVES